jgi:hypothetical protein
MKSSEVVVLRDHGSLPRSYGIFKLGARGTKNELKNRQNRAKWNHLDSLRIH